MAQEGHTGMGALTQTTDIATQHEGALIRKHNCGAQGANFHIRQFDRVIKDDRRISNRSNCRQALGKNIL